MISFKTFANVHIFDCLTTQGLLTGYHFDYPSSLKDKEKEQIFEVLYPIALSAFSQNDSNTIRSDVFEHIFSADGLLIVVDESVDSTAVAFRMWDIVDLSVVDGDILYLAGMCVRKEYQRRGIGNVLLNYVLHQDLRRQMIGKDQVCPLPKCQYIILRTQNPAMKFYFDCAVGGVSYPTIEKDVIPEDIKKAASVVAKYLKDDHFDPKTLVSRSLYGRSLYGHELNVSNERYKELFSSLNSNNGDAMMCVWRRK